MCPIQLQVMQHTGFRSILDSPRGRAENYFPDFMRTPMGRFARMAGQLPDKRPVSYNDVRPEDLSFPQLLVQRIVTNCFPRTFVSSIYFGSMMPTLRAEDRVVCLERMYLGLAFDPEYPKISDIISFWSPDIKQAEIKRVCGLPGDSPFSGVVPAFHVFVQGDNSDDSIDSRFWGFLPIQNVFGIVLGKCPEGNAYELVVPFGHPDQRVPLRDAIRFGHTL